MRAPIVIDGRTLDAEAPAFVIAEIGVPILSRNTHTSTATTTPTMPIVVYWRLR